MKNKDNLDFHKEKDTDHIENKVLFGGVDESGDFISECPFYTKLYLTLLMAKIVNKS